VPGGFADLVYEVLGPAGTCAEVTRTVQLPTWRGSRRHSGVLAGVRCLPTVAVVAASSAAAERGHVAVPDLVTVNVVHPGYETLPLSVVSALAGGPALRPTMEYPGGWLIQ
jgi:hypothetical protein